MWHQDLVSKVKAYLMSCQNNLWKDGDMILLNTIRKVLFVFKNIAIPLFVMNLIRCNWTNHKYYFYLIFILHHNIPVPFNLILINLYWAHSSILECIEYWRRWYRIVVVLGNSMISNIVTLCKTTMLQVKTLWCHLSSFMIWIIFDGLNQKVTLMLLHNMSNGALIVTANKKEYKG